MNNILHQHTIISEEVARQIIFKLITTLKEIHLHRIVHRDIKLENIMFRNKDQRPDSICFIDFGFSRFLDEIGNAQTSIGTNGYQSPQIVKGEPYTDKTDIWSLGVVLYLM